MKAWIMMLALMGTTYTTAMGQNMAVRFIIGEMGKTYEKPGISGYAMGMGLDRTFNDNLTIGLDFSVDLAALIRDIPVQVYDGLYGSTTDGSFRVIPRMFSLNYHTEFALGDNGRTHAYVGTFIGLKRIRMNWEMDHTEYDVYGYSYAMSSSKSVSLNLFPVGLRLGLRGPADDRFGDLYAMIGYQIGGGKKTLDALPTSNGPYSKTSALVFGFGLASGIGW